MHACMYGCMYVRLQIHLWLYSQGWIPAQTDELRLRAQIGSLIWAFRALPASVLLEMTQTPWHPNACVDNLRKVRDLTKPKGKCATGIVPWASSERSRALELCVTWSRPWSWWLPKWSLSRGKPRLLAGTFIKSSILIFQKPPHFLLRLWGGLSVDAIVPFVECRISARFSQGYMTYREWWSDPMAVAFRICLS